MNVAKVCVCVSVWKLIYKHSFSVFCRHFHAKQNVMKNTINFIMHILNVANIYARTETGILEQIPQFFFWNYRITMTDATFMWNVEIRLKFITYHSPMFLCHTCVRENFLQEIEKKKLRKFQISKVWKNGFDFTFFRKCNSKIDLVPLYWFHEEKLWELF